MCLALAAILPIGLALAAGPNQRDVEPQPNVLDTDDITKPDSTVWVLNFRFKDPRLVMVNIPGRGCRVCLYMWYQVINNTNEPHLFIPDFELVTHDKNSVHHDHILPTAQEVISRIERDNIGTPIKNSVTIFAEPIPPQKPLAIERSVTGVAIWDDVDPESNHYSIFVSGLSNGSAVTDPIPPSKEGVTRRKTLQLEFRRLGDAFLQNDREIQFVAPAKWIYREGILPK